MVTIASDQDGSWCSLYSLLLIQSKTLAQRMILPVFMVDLPSVKQINSYRLSDYPVYYTSFIFSFLVHCILTIVSPPSIPYSSLPPLSHINSSTVSLQKGWASKACK